MIKRLCLIAYAGVLLVSGAPEQASGEYAVKGAFLLNFVKFVQWPPQAFKSAGDPIVICVLGSSPFGPELDRAAKGLVIGGRGVSVRQVADGPQATQCQIVFVSASERKRSRGVLECLKGLHVLTVGESDDFIPGGGVIGFRVEGERIRIEISIEAAERANLRISAKLLSLAVPAKR